MKANFEQCLEWLLKHEGGFVNHPKDPGGMTNKGITARVYGQWLSDAMDVDAEVTEHVMQNISDSHVEQIYRQEYWNRMNCDRLPAGVDWMCFDFGVNAGTGRGARTLQKSVGATADGGIGPKTLAAVAGFDSDVIIEDMYHRRQAFYERLKTFDTFGTGWTRRNDETREQAIGLMQA